MGPNMPVSSVDCETAIKCSSAIRDSLASSASSSNGLQSQILTSAKLALLGTIEYEESPPDFRHNVTESIKTKYTVLTANNNLNGAANQQQNSPPTSTMGSSPSTTNGSSSTAANGGLSQKNGPQIPTPKRVLYDRELVHIGWKKGRKWSVGTGMTNVGNTCYLNSTLQALFHVPAFANWLYSDEEHRHQCDTSKYCIICAMARTLKETQESNNQSIKPYYVYSKLREVCRHLVPGDQEDAHEFLRYLVEAMEKAYLLRYKDSKEFDQYTKETTPLNQILGGYLKSSVRCLSCDHVSVTFQHFQDLLLDIRKSTSIEEALDIHFARERLEDMGYKCESCKRKVSATKQFSMERAPITLCIQLKRFSMMGGKINKHISFATRLNLSKYSARKSGDDRQMIYRLVSVVTHLGSSQHCGHYTAVGLTQNGNYYNFDDSSVRQIPVQNVLQSNAYIIFYELEDPTAMAASSPSPKVNCTNTSRVMEPTNGVKKSFIGPVLPPTIMTTNGHDPKTNGTEATPKPLTSHLVLNISQTNSTNKTWGTSKLVTNAHNKTNGISTPTTPTSNGHLYKNTTGLTPDINKKLKVTNGGPTLVAGTNHQKSDTNSTTITTTLNGKSSLPSMPKLDAAAISHTVIPKLPTPSQPSTTNHINGSSSSRTPPSSPEGTPAPVGPNKSNGTPKVNVFTKVQVTPLVPYEDDSSDHSGDETSKSPPIVKTKAGLFHVTSTDTVANGGSAASSANTSLSSLSPVSSTGSVVSASGAMKRVASKPSDADNSSTVSKLLKNSHQGYGAPVSTWGGHATGMELELKADRQEELERKRDIDVDASMDRGRSKKIKPKNHVNGDSNPSYNPFNEMQLNANARCFPQYHNSHNNNKRRLQNHNRC